MQTPEVRPEDQNTPEKAPFPTMPVVLAIVGALLLIALIFLA